MIIVFLNVRRLLSSKRRLTLLFFLCFLVQSFAGVSAQKLSLDVKNAHLREVLSELRKQSGVSFVITTTLLDETRPVTASFTGYDLNKALETILAEQPIVYTIKGKMVRLARKMNRTGQLHSVSESSSEQQSNIAGKVLDSDGNALAGVSVAVKNSDVSTVTSEDGSFGIVSDLQGTLVFSYIGYRRQEVPIANRVNLEISLIAEMSNLDEVVVVGYGVQRKSDLTGAISSVSNEQIGAFPLAGTAEALQGRAPGIAVSSINGEPGQSPRVRIRGGTSINASSDPLYVIDGFAGGSPPPPEDVASVEILKDASATAIYGSRGANGVIVITTKKGKVGKPVIALKNSYSFQEVAKRLELLDGQEFAAYINDVYINSGNNNIPYPDPSVFGKGTDWQDLVFRQGALFNNQIAISGGSENVRYYNSFSHFGQKGTIINSHFKRLSGTSNIDFTINPKLKIGTKMFFVRNERDGVRTQETTSGGVAGVGVVSAALRFEPIQGVYDEQGKYPIKKIGDPHDNPIAAAKERTDEMVGELYQGNVYGQLELFPDLTFRSTFGVQVNNNRTGTYVSKNLVEGRSYGGAGQIATLKNLNLINENYFNYTKTVADDHVIDAMAGYSYQSSRNEDWTASNRNFVSDKFSYWNLGAGSNYQSALSDLSDWVMSSFYGRLNYNYKGRYMLTVTGRYDGSSRFGANNKWAFFPSGALAWNVANEDFADAWETVTDLKIRASYGATGNTEIGSYQSLARFSSTLATIDGQPVNAVRPTNVANPSLTWETTRQTDVGLDMGLWGHRVTLNVDYYYKKTSDLLYEVPLPNYSGYLTTLQNIGSVENKGVEFGLGADVLTGGVRWNTGFNISFNRNKILTLPGGDIRYNSVPGQILSTESQILREGEVVGAFYGWIFDGVYQTGDDFSMAPNKRPGDVKYRDILGRDRNNNITDGPNGVVNADDRTVIGNPHPDFIYGFNNDIHYKRFDFSVFFQGSQGNDMLNITRMELDWMAGKGNATKDALRRWTPENPDTDVPRASASNNPEVSSRWVEDGSYLRLKNISLGYSFPDFNLGVFGVKSLRVYMSAQNIWTLTKYKGYNPEVSFQDSNRNVGLDYMGYPAIKSVMAGINVEF